jgi:tetratricopeptide (TPR) repeat protein
MRTVLLILAYLIVFSLPRQAVRAAEPDLRQLMDSPGVAPCIEAVSKVESQVGWQDAIHTCEQLLTTARLPSKEKSIIHGILGSAYFSQVVFRLDFSQIMVKLESDADSEKLAGLLTADDKRDIMTSTRYYTLALENWPNSPMAYYNLWNRGFNKEFLGRFEDALSDYDAVVRLSPDFLKGYLYRARMLVMLGKRDQARADLENAFRLAPYDPAVINAMKVLYDPAVVNAMKALLEDDKEQE